MKKIPLSTYGLNFIESPYIPAGKDEFYLRYEQTEHWDYTWRNLKTQEIEQLEDQLNICSNWDMVLVEDPIDLTLIRNNAFYGLVRIGSMQSYVVGHNDFFLPEGIRDSLVVSSDIGRHCAIQKCAYISHYIIEEGSILSEINELVATNHHKGGVGIVMEGEEERVRIKFGIMNENEGRWILPFKDLTCADAYLWGTYRENQKLMERLVDFTNRSKDRRLGRYGLIGTRCVIKSCRIIKDVDFGPHVYVKGANKLKNLTVKSSQQSPSQIGEGVELVNGIIGYGCKVFYGVKAVRFVMGNNSNLKYGARLLNSVLGDNSTISCCEVLNSLVFPYHEQHHNNSFLIAALIEGQSNMAAGATIGSNHNTRSNDGEFIAGRGFWPALSSSIKYNSRFAPFAMVVKGNFPNELNVPLPFALISFHEHDSVLQVIPAYWWLYNRYALERNQWKFKNRDRRKHVAQQIEVDYLSPEILESILEARSLLELWVGQSVVTGDYSEQELRALGKKRLTETTTNLPHNVTTTTLERSLNPSEILKVAEAYHAYGEMLIYGCCRSLLTCIDTHCNAKNPRDIIAQLRTLQQTSASMQAATSAPYVNLGGQIVSQKQVDSLIEKIVTGTIDSWPAVHEEYEKWHQEYPKAKAIHALRLVEEFYQRELNESLWAELIENFTAVVEGHYQEIVKTREKDYEEPFRKSTYRNDEEMLAVLGDLESSEFIVHSQEIKAYHLGLAETYRNWFS